MRLWLIVSGISMGAMLISALSLLLSLFNDEPTPWGFATFTYVCAIQLDRIADKLKKEFENE